MNVDMTLPEWEGWDSHQNLLWKTTVRPVGYYCVVSIKFELTSRGPSWEVFIEGKQNDVPLGDFETIEEAKAYADRLYAAIDGGNTDER